MLDNVTKLMPQVWEFLNNSRMLFYNTSPAMYEDELAYREFPRHIFSTLFGTGYENYREVFCVTTSSQQTLNLTARLATMGFESHEHHSFLDRTLGQEYRHIFRHVHENLVLAVVTEYTPDSDSFSDYHIAPTVPIWEVMKPRMLSLIEALADEALRCHEMNKPFQSYLANWFAHTSRTEFLHAKMTVLKGLSLGQPVTEPDIKPVKRARKAPANKPYLKPQ